VAILDHTLTGPDVRTRSVILAHAQAPAYPKRTRLHLLQWSHYVQAADVLFDKQKDEFAIQAGVEIQVKRINQNDIQSRVTAAVQSGAGADIIIVAKTTPTSTRARSWT
jgi:maltose-binding protein MalE